MTRQDIRKDFSKIVQESGINLSGASFGILQHYILLMVLTRFLSPREYGTFALGQSVVNVGLILALAGTPSILERFIPFFNAMAETGKIKTLIYVVFSTVLTSSAVCTVVMYLGSRFIAHAIFSNDPLHQAIKVMAFGLPMLAFMQIVSSTFIGFKELRYHSIIQYITLPLLMIILAIVLLIARKGLAAWTWMYVLSLLGTSLLSLWFILKKIWPILSKIQESRVSLYEMFSYCWPMSVTGFIILFLGQLDSLLLGYFETAKEVGIYRIYWSLALVMSVIQDSFGKIYKPTASFHAAKKDIGAVREIYQRTTKWNILINIFIAGLFAIMGRQIVLSFFAPEYTVYFGAFLIMIGGHLTNSLFGYQGKTLEALGNVQLLLFNNLVRLVLNVALAFLLIPPFGVYGAALATSSALIAVNVISYLEIHFLYEMKLFDKIYLRAVAGVFIIMGISLFVKFLAKFYWGIEFDIPLACGFTIVQILFISKYGADANDRQILHAVCLKLWGAIKKS